MSNSYQNCPVCGRLIEVQSEVCPHCGTNLAATQVQAHSGVNEYGNTSGQKKFSAVPPEVANHFNWGAFFFNWIWALVYGKYLLAPIVLLVNFIPFIGGLISLGLCIWMGTQANKWAWQNRKYKNIENFHLIHKIWATAGLIWMMMIMVGVIAVMTIPTLLNTTQDVQYKVGAKKALTVLYQSTQVAVAKDIKTTGYSSSEITDFFEQFMHGERTANVIKTSDGIVYKFESNGMCVDKNCYVEVDVNGDVGPNELWENPQEPKDVIIIPMRATQNNQIGVYMPKVLSVKE